MGHAGSPITIVIADDHLSFGEALQIALDKERDMRVVAVVMDGLTAVEVVKERSPDVVLLDLQMPGIDGLEAARRIRDARPDVTVIVLTGAGDELSLGRSAQAGAHGFLQKTEAVGDLAQAIRRARRGEPINEPADVERALSGLRRRREQDGSMAQRLSRLTPRELEILQRLAEGQAPDQIAAELGMSKHTLRTHTQNVLTKLGVHSKLEAIVVAIRHGKVRTAEVVDLTAEEEPEPIPANGD